MGVKERSRWGWKGKEKEKGWTDQMVNGATLFMLVSIAKCNIIK